MPERVGHSRGGAGERNRTLDLLITSLIKSIFTYLIKTLQTRTSATFQPIMTLTQVYENSLFLLASASPVLASF